jgi:hypothetical protein
MLGLRPRCRMPLFFISCSRLACAQAAAAARVAGKGGIHKAAERGNVATVQDYLIADASCMDQPDGQWIRYNLTPPSPACIAVFAMLISSCVYVIWPDSCSFSKNTPLHCAASQGHVAVVQLLLSCNAAVDARAQLYGSYSDHCIVDENT